MKIYAEVLEESAMEQFKEAMAQHYVVDGALMPDAHTGYSLPIGAVVATKDHIVPSWVGYDIGCGMCAMKLDLKDFDKEKLFEDIYKHIPVGRVQFETKQDVPEATSELITKGLEKKGHYQLGTLGGGNHFLEVGVGNDGNTWIVIHSGSRNLGHFVAEHYMKLAKVKNFDSTAIEEAFYIGKEVFKEKNPEAYDKALEKHIEKELSGLSDEGHYAFHAESDEGQAYLSDMAYCLNYALENRKAMVMKVKELLGNPEELMFINKNHNHAEYRDGLYFHRKGATQADEGMLGVIPGNMRDGSFVVMGKGNKDSLYSSSHGAGRVLSRKKAQATLDMETFRESMTEVVAKVDTDTLDESPLAYKNIFEVMALQKDLVEVLDHIRPLVNIKG